MKVKQSTRSGLRPAGKAPARRRIPADKHLQELESAFHDTIQKDTIQKDTIQKDTIQKDTIQKSRDESSGAAPFGKFCSILGMLQSGAGSYSNRFLGYWSKQPPAHYADRIELSAGRGKIGFDEAWMIVTAWCFATGEPGQWSRDIPALVTHWLTEPDDVLGMIDHSVTENWTLLLKQVAGSGLGKLKITPPDAPLEVTKKSNKKCSLEFRFIDLFAGVGGFRLALSEAGGKCVFSSEINEKARETYFQNYGHWPFGDLTRFSGDHSDRDIPTFIPEHDIIAAGFPCQPFSQAGQKLGFDDARGTLFFDILKIARARRPRVLFLENVKGLRGHKRGHTFRVICKALKEIGYKVYSKVISARDFGVPQNRQRIFIVAFREPIEFAFPEPDGTAESLCIGDILEPKPDPKFTISERMWTGHQKRKQRHKENGNGFGYSLFQRSDNYVNTISARYWKDGSEILIHQPRKSTPRVLTPRECARLQGFPDEFVLHKSSRANYQQFGNSVAVPVIRAITAQIVEALGKNRLVTGGPTDAEDPLEPVHY